MNLPCCEAILSERLLLEPLAAAHAAEMAEVLARPSLYEYMGGEAPSMEQLHRR